MDARSAFEHLFGAPRALIGMVHLGALPGAPTAHHAIDKLVAHAVGEARAYRDAGFGALLIENMHDRPYLRGAVGPEVVAAMTAIGREIRRDVDLPLGVQVLAAANPEAVPAPHPSGASFVRLHGFLFRPVAA